MERKNKPIIFTICALISLFISSSTAMAVNLAKTEVLPIEVVDSDKVIFKNVRIIDKNGCVQVKGSVKPQRKHGPGVYGHVDIELLDIEGRIVEKERVNHTPAYLQTKGNKLSYFTFALGEDMQNSSKVRVSYHYTRNDGKKVCDHKH